MQPLFKFGTPVRFTKDKEDNQHNENDDNDHLEVLALKWEALNVRRPTTDDDLTSFAKRAGDSPAVYAFEALIDSQGARSIVYVGVTTRSVKKRFKDSRSSLGLVGYLSNDEFLPWSDVVDLTVRWAKIPDTRFLGLAERVLVAAHAPAFNQGLIRKDLAGQPAERLVIMNVGDKGRLLPVVAGAYYSSSGKLWSAE